jgi:hypothetical protein
MFLRETTMKALSFILVAVAFIGVLFFSLEAKVNQGIKRDEARQAGFDEVCTLGNGKILVVDNIRFCSIADKIIVHR